MGLLWYVVDKPWGAEEDHAYVDGKPLLVLFEVTEEMRNAYDGDRTYTDKFTLRYAVGTTPIRLESGDG